MEFDCSNLVTLINDMLNLSYFDDEIIKASFTPENKTLLVITGENATGKSFVRRLVQSICKLEKIELIHLSQEGRSRSGIVSSLIYGDESNNSTGYLTSNLITTGINTCQKRTSKHFIFWDEPDIGLSDKYAAAVGIKIKEFVENLPNLTTGVIVTTHRKCLVYQLLPLKPSLLRLGDKKTLRQWFDEVIKPGDLNELSEKNNKLFEQIQKILKP